MSQSYSASPMAFMLSLWRHRELIWVSVGREVSGRYRGSVLGLFWSFFNPLLMLAVYTFVFGEVFKARWSAESTSKPEFALILFSGLMVFNIFSECLNRSPGLIIFNQNYVKKVLFPIEIISVVAVISALYHGMISAIVWLIAYVFFFGIPSITLLYIPVVFIPFAMMTLGMSWILASLGVYLRDVTQVVGVLTTVLMFLSPIFYPATALPESYQYLIYINPLTPVIEVTRDVMFWGKQPDMAALASIWVLGGLSISVGFFWFQKTRKGFADVM